MHNIRHIAQSYWADGACVGVTPMTIPIIRRAIPVYWLDTNGDGKGDYRIEHVAAFRHAPEDRGGPPYTNCDIIVDDRHWTTEELCKVVAGHESGHASGWTAPPGEEYRGVWGIDRYHSNDPLSIMWPWELAPWPPCEDGAANAR